MVYSNVYFLSVLWCSQSGDRPKNSLAKFGYIHNLKVLKNSKFSIFLITCWNLSWNSRDLDFEHWFGA